MIENKVLCLLNIGKLFIWQHLQLIPFPLLQDHIIAKLQLQMWSNKRCFIGACTSRAERPTVETRQVVLFSG